MIAVLMLLCLLSGTVLADTMHREVPNPDIEITAELGYDGAMTYGKVMPLRVRIVNHGEDLEGVLGMNAYATALDYNRYETEISVPSGAEKVYVLPFSVLTKQNIFTPEILRDGQVVRAVNLTPDLVINPSSMLIGVLSTRPRMMANLDISRDNDTLSRYEFWQTVPLTSDTFPETAELLNAFGMLVVDDIDLATLTAAQQQALKDWILSGHILFCGGGRYAAQNISFFTEMTGLTAGQAESAGTVLSTLEIQAGAAASGAHPEILISRVSGGEPIVADEEGRGLIYRTEADKGRIYTAAFEIAESRLNTESLMHYFWQQLLVQFDADRYNAVLYAYDRTDAVMTYANDGALSVQTSSSLLPAALTALGVMMLGCGIWLVLKKKDKRSLMWVVLPVLSLAAAGVILLLSGSSGLNRPMAVYTETIVQDAAGDANRSIGISVAAPRAGMHQYSLEGAPLFVGYNESVWIDEDERPSEPVNMRMRYTTGREPYIGKESTAPWEAQSIMSSGTVNIGGKLEGAAWMEPDGIHGEIRNGTGLDLKAGTVLSGFGYVSVPALKSGESISFTLLDRKTDRVQDGVMVSTASLYVMTYYVVGMEEYAYQPGTIRSLKQQMLGSIMEQLAGSDVVYSYGDMTGAVFLYVAEPENPVPFTLRVDGEPVENRNGLTLFGAKLNYEKVGRTGMIYHTPGMDSAIRVETDMQGMPGKEAASKPGYVNLNEAPVFRFTVEDAVDAEISVLRIMIDSWYMEEAKCFLLDMSTREWTEIDVNKDVKNPERFVDDGGNIYCQFRAVRDEGYQEIPAPTLMLQGQVREGGEKHAED